MNCAVCKQESKYTDIRSVLLSETIKVDPNNFVLSVLNAKKCGLFNAFEMSPVTVHCFIKQLCCEIFTISIQIQFKCV